MPDQIHAVNVRPEELLGPPVLNCRLLAGWRTMRGQGFVVAWLMYYLVYPLMVIPYLALMTAMLVFFLIGFDIDQMTRNPAYWVLWGAFYAGAFWYVYILPRGDRLVLHEKGFRVRLGFKDLAVRIEDLGSLALGRPVSTLEGGLRQVLRFAKPSQVAWLDGLDGTALTLYLRDGRTKIFTKLLTRFDPEDLNSFFNHLADKHPQLVGRVEAE